MTFDVDASDIFKVHLSFIATVGGRSSRHIGVDIAEYILPAIALR